MMNDVLNIPKSWVQATISDIGKVISGGTPSTRENAYWGGNISWISPSDLTGYSSKHIVKGAKSITQEGLKNSSATIMPAGSIHFSSRAPIGYTVISAIDMTTNQGFKSLVPAQGIFNEYIYYYFKSAKQLAESKATGTTFKEISGTAFSKLPVPIPPTNEQHRIVAKIEELFSELDKGIENLKTARAQLKVYRQALLKHAFEGKLTAQWRKENQDKLETADALQQRIQQEREQRYRQQLKSPSVPLLQRGKLTSAAATTSHPPLKKGGRGDLKPKAPKLLPPLTAAELAELPELPEGWGYIQIGNLLDVVSGNTPKGIEATKGTEIPYYRVSDMNRDGNEVSMNASATYLSENEAAKIGLNIYSVGTIIFPKRGGAIATNKKRRLARRSCFDLNLMGLTNLPDSLSAGYLWLWILSLDLASISDGSNVPQINNRNVEPLAFPICSFEEQALIIELAEARLSEADQLDQTITTSLQQAEALRQSILKKAFSGQLVAQDANDEPAAALLARIRAEKDAQSATSRKTGRGKA
jgi:type I restriction enzyme S subunit